MAPSGERQRIEANLAVVRTLLAQRAEQRPATPQEQAVYARWSGWGAVPALFDERPQVRDQFARERAELRSLLGDAGYAAARRTTLNAHYTDAAYVQHIWQALAGMGFEGGRVLEPGCGSGTFIGFAPDGTQPVGVELDPTTAAVAQILYPQARILAESFADTRIPNESFDLVVGNVPFGNYRLHDPTHNPGRRHSIHNHFILKSLRLTRPGGMVALITSRYTLDGTDESHQHARTQMAELADLVGAVRLPTDAHKVAAGTEVVTDLLVFRRRPVGAPVQDAPWLGTRTLPAPTERDPDNTLAVNAYFVEHPDMVLGEMTAVSSRHGPTLGVRDDRPTTAALADALTRLAAHAREAGLTMTTAPADADQPLILHGPMSEQEGLFIDRGDGTFQQIVEGHPQPHKPPKTQVAELRALIGLRTVIVALLDEEAAHIEHTDRMDVLRRDLNDRYDRYVAQYGPINRFKLSYGKEVEDPETGEITRTERRVYPQLGGFKDDPFWPYVAALEDFSEETGEARKASVFADRVIAPPTPVELVETAADALVVCWDRYNEVRLDEIARLLGMDSEEQARRALDGLVFEEPGTGLLVRKVDYLSGNVRRKLVAAEQAVASDARFGVNVGALRAVIPRDRTIGEISASARLGAPWIPVADVQQFVREVLEDPKISVGRVGAAWSVKGGDRRAVLATTVWGTESRCAQDLIANLLNNQNIEVTKRVGPKGNEKSVRDSEATALAQAKAMQLDDRFRQWLWEDPQRGDRLHREFNDRFNAEVLPSYEGERVTAPGLSTAAFELRPHQHAAVARIRNTPSVGLYHGTGAGKTLEMIVGGMELRRLGLVRKPCYVVPKAVLSQFQREFLHAYPRARILGADTSDLTGDERRRFVARCSTGDWDAVIMSHDAFKRIPVSKTARLDYLNTRLDRMRDHLTRAEGADRHTIKDLENQIANKEEEIKELLATPTDSGVEFERTGIDYLFVDEAHAYKNLQVLSSIQELAHEGNQITTDMDMKLGYLRRSGATRVVTMATATPWDNSPAEVLTQLKYLCPEKLAEQGLEEDEQFLAMYVQPRRRVEMTPDGSRFVSRLRYARFANVQALKRTVFAVADVKLKEHLRLGEPAIIGGGQEILSVPASPELRDYLAGLAGRARSIAGGDPDLRRTKKGELKKDNILWISTDGRKASLAMEMVGQSTDHPQKLDMVADRMAELWHAHKDDIYYDQDGNPEPNRGSLILGFCDLGVPGAEWSAYEALRDKLVDRDVPTGKIRFAQDAAKDQRARGRMQRDAWNGEIGILIGSRAGMGTGLNIQRRVVAVVQIDPTWKLTPLVQSLGRGLRQGNANAAIHHIITITEGSYDPFFWQKVDDKDKFTRQILDPNDLTTDIIDLDQVADNGGAIDPAVAFAVGAGDPGLLELYRLEESVSALQLEQRIYHNEQVTLQGSIAQNHRRIQIATSRLADIDEALARRVDTQGDAFSMTLSGRVYDKRVDAGEALVARLMAGGVGAAEAGTIGGFTFRVKGSSGNVQMILDGVPDGVLTFSTSELATSNPVGVVRQVENKIAGLDKGRARIVEQIDRLRVQVDQAQRRLGEPWPRQKELDEQVTRLNALQRQFTGERDPNAKPEGVTAGTAAQDKAVPALAVAGEPPAVPDTASPSLSRTDEQPAPVAVELPEPNRVYQIQPPGGQEVTYTLGLDIIEELASPSDGTTVRRTADGWTVIDERGQEYVVTLTDEEPSEVEYLTRVEFHRGQEEVLRLYVEVRRLTHTLPLDGAWRELVEWGATELPKIIADPPARRSGFDMAEMSRPYRILAGIVVRLDAPSAVAPAVAALSRQAYIHQGRITATAERPRGPQTWNSSRRPQVPPGLDSVPAEPSDLFAVTGAGWDTVLSGAELDVVLRNHDGPSAYGQVLLGQSEGIAYQALTRDDRDASRLLTAVLDAAPYWNALVTVAAQSDSPVRPAATQVSLLAVDYEAQWERWIRLHQAQLPEAPEDPAVAGAARTLARAITLHRARCAPTRAELAVAVRRELDSHFNQYHPRRDESGRAALADALAVAAQPRDPVPQDRLTEGIAWLTALAEPPSGDKADNRDIGDLEAAWRVLPALRRLADLADLGQDASERPEMALALPAPAPAAEATTGSALPFAAPSLEQLSEHARWVATKLSPADVDDIELMVRDAVTDDRFRDAARACRSWEEFCGVLADHLGGQVEALLADLPYDGKGSVRRIVEMLAYRNLTEVMQAAPIRSEPERGNASTYTIGSASGQEVDVTQEEVPGVTAAVAPASEEAADTPDASTDLAEDLAGPATAPDPESTLKLLQDIGPGVLKEFAGGTPYTSRNRIRGPRRSVAQMCNRLLRERGWQNRPSHPLTALATAFKTTSVDGTDPAELLRLAVLLARQSATTVKDLSYYPQSTHAALLDVARLAGSFASDLVATAARPGRWERVFGSVAPDLRADPQTYAALTAAAPTSAVRSESHPTAVASSENLTLWALNEDVLSVPATADDVGTRSADDAAEAGGDTGASAAHDSAAIVTGPPPPTDSAADVLPPSPEVVAAAAPAGWSDRIRIEDGASLIVAGTTGEPREAGLREVLKQHRFRFHDRQAGSWRYTGRRAGRAAAAAAVRAWLAEQDAVNATRPESSSRFPPTPQQQEIIDAYLAGRDVVVQALAGTGKTSTLVMLAEARPERIAYIAFNRSIAAEAQAKFPRYVTAKTSHGFARAGLQNSSLRTKVRQAGKWHPGARRPDEWAAILGIQPVRVSDQVVIEPDVLAAVVKSTLQRFRQSDHDAIDVRHLPGDYQGPQDAPLVRALLGHSRAAWQDITDPEGKLHFDFDDYLKIWALSRPRLPYDVIFFDEAQDINPVLAKVIQDQPAQKVVVGDSNQSIYGFRGAVDALNRWPGDVELPLTQSWRFGPAVADTGNAFLGLLESPWRLAGNPALASSVGPVEAPDAVLARTNAGAVAAVFEGFDAGRTVALVGGGRDIEDIAHAALDLQAGRTTRHPELAHFRDWDEVCAYVEREDGGQALRAFVRLVDRRGARALLEMVDDLVDENATRADGAPAYDVIVSTVHKAKGLEWPTVRIAEDFPAPTENTDTGQVTPPGPEELRLAYVAVTRARDRLDLGSLSWIQEYAPGPRAVTAGREPQRAQPASAVQTSKQPVVPVVARQDEPQASLAETLRRRRGHAFYPPASLAVPTVDQARAIDPDERTIYVKYFGGSADFWIAGLDRDTGMAYGYTCLGDPDYAEWGNIFLPEVEQLHRGLVIIERDLHWQPTSVRKADLPGWQSLEHSRHATEATPQEPAAHPVRDDADPAWLTPARRAQPVKVIEDHAPRYTAEWQARDKAAFDALSVEARQALQAGNLDRAMAIADHAEPLYHHIDDRSDHRTTAQDWGPQPYETTPPGAPIPSVPERLAAYRADLDALAAHATADEQVFAVVGNTSNDLADIREYVEQWTTNRLIDVMTAQFDSGNARQVSRFLRDYLGHDDSGVGGMRAAVAAYLVDRVAAAQQDNNYRKPPPPTPPTTTTYPTPPSRRPASDHSSSR